MRLIRPLLMRYRLRWIRRRLERQRLLTRKRKPEPVAGLVSRTATH
jgi:hypothetical protein